MFSFASSRVVSLFTFKTDGGRDTPSPEDEIEMQELLCTQTGGDDHDSAPEPETNLERSDGDLYRRTAALQNTKIQTHSHTRQFEYSSINWAMGMRAPR